MAATRPLTFSQRHGHAPLPDPVQLESLDNRTRTAIWNVLHTWLLADSPSPDRLEDFWVDFYGMRSDYFADYKLGGALETTVFKGDWHEVNSLLEFIAWVTPDYDQQLLEVLNGALRYHLCGYRIVGGQVVEITDETELDAIRDAASLPDDSPVRKHIESALKLFADRENPDYANSIKESISAVEAAARDLSGNPTATLGAALDLIAKQRDGLIHPALLKGWKNIYGFTSDASGIRHADSKDGASATQPLAQYFLVTCSAMANMMVTLAADSPPAH